MGSGEAEPRRLQQRPELHNNNQCWPSAAGLFCIFMKLLISRQQNVQ